MDKPRIIAVVGGGAVGVETLKNARRLGAEIVRNAILLTGGDGSDETTVKDAAVRGARDASPTARIISILKESGGLREGSSIIFSGLEHGRNVLNALAADAMIVLEGNAGTLSEAAFAQMTCRRVVLFGGAEKKLEETLATANFRKIAAQSAKLQTALSVECTEANVKYAAHAALAKGFKSGDVAEAVAYAMKAELLANFPPIEGVDLNEYQKLLTRFGR